MKNVHLLIAEDDEEDRMLIEMALSKIKFEGKIHFANNGEELIRYLRVCTKRDEAQDSACPNLVILDLNMPKLNGWETLERLKSDGKWSDVPVVIFTTSTSEEDIKACYQRGASCFISKPDSYQGYVDTFRSFNQFWGNTVQLPK